MSPVAQIPSDFAGFLNTNKNCGRQRTFDDCDACALVQYVRKNRRATLPQVTENVTVGYDQQEQSVDSYIERDVIVGLQCINPSLQR